MGHTEPSALPSDAQRLVSLAAAGDRRALGRLLSWTEDSLDHSRAVAEALREAQPRAYGVPIVGITGAPGVGKSTLTAALVAAYRARDERVGVLAVDPSSPVTGGALLGDRVRMQEHATDPGVVIRSMAARGHLGGLAAAAPQAVRVLAVGGVERVLVETVGVGQSEVEVAAGADTVLVLVAPGSGDGVQVAKAGLLEVADVFVVTKGDRAGADELAKELRQAMGVVADPGEWAAPVVVTAATTGAGIDEVVAAIDEHHEWAGRSGEAARRRDARIAGEVEALALGQLRRRWSDVDTDTLSAVAGQVAAGTLNPWEAADRLIG